MSENTVEATQHYLTVQGKGHTAILTSFRRNGDGVGTPVGTVSSDGKLYFMTAANTWKVKRLAHNPRITLAPGTYRGKVLGPAIEGTAHRIYGEEMQQARKLLRVGVLGHFFGFLYDWRNPGDKTAVYEISLATLDKKQDAATS